MCEYIAETSAQDKTASFLYALGWTQHSVGAQNIRTMAMVQLLLGNMGMAGGGVNALRGHSNIQGLTDLGLLSQSLPGYMTLPSEKQTDLQTYLTANTPKPLLEGQVNYWGNYPKFFVSMMKAFFGDKATAENSWGFDWLPKWDKGYDVLQYFEMMYQGKVNGYLCQGFNPVASFPNKNKVVASLSKLKFLVTIDPLNTETSDLLAEPRRVQRRRSGEDPDRSVPPAVNLLRRRERLDRQLRPLAAVALEGRRRPGRSHERRRDPGRHLYAPAQDVCRRRAARARNRC